MDTSETLHPPNLKFLEDENGSLILWVEERYLGENEREQGFKISTELQFKKVLRWETYNDEPLQFHHKSTNLFLSEIDEIVHLSE